MSDRASSSAWLSAVLPMSVVTAATVCGCAVGPTYGAPAAPAGSAYLGERVPGSTESTDLAGGAAQRFDLGRDLSGQWWELLGSSRLNALINEAIASYPGIAAQQAALRAARESVRTQKGLFFPQIQGVSSGLREQVSGASIGPGYPGFITDVYQATVNVSYTFDLFGGERRALERLLAQAQAQRFQLEASFLTLTSNVASTVIQLASLNDQIAATQEIIASETRELEIVRMQFDAGSQSMAEVAQQRSNLALIRATLPSLEQERSTAEHQLAVLTGHDLIEGAHPLFTLSELTLPVELPVSLPSTLVLHRPDIQVQEAQLRQASANVGVATANMLPQLTLTGAFGGESLVFNTLLQPESGVWNIAGGITQPIFEGGALRAKRRAAMDLYDQASAEYKLTVVKAFQNVADTLTALEHDSQALKAESDAVESAKQSLDLLQKQFNAGTASYVSLLLAQQAHTQARLALIQVVASRYTDTVTLFQALGGGWWNRTNPAPI